MVLAHGGEISADEIGELVLLSLPVLALLTVLVVLTLRARAQTRRRTSPPASSPGGSPGGSPTRGGGAGHG